jgi:hypothetical protein
MSAVQYYLLEWDSGHLLKLLERLQEAGTATHVTVSRVEGEIDHPVHSWRDDVRYAVRLTAEQIADLTVHGLYGLYDFDGCRAVKGKWIPSYGGYSVQTKDKKFRAGATFTL